ncbi:MAG TPA: hypothetical protein VIL48_14040 [Acidimicrobiales bacterium]
MLDPRVLPLKDKGPVRATLVLSRLGQATVDVEDQATASDPGTVSLRMGDENTAVLLQGDLRTVQRLIIEADRQLTHLRHARECPGRPARPG